MENVLINHFALSENEVYENIENENWKALGLDVSDSDFVVVEILNGAFRLTSIKAEDHYICTEDSKVRVFTV